MIVKDKIEAGHAAKKRRLAAGFADPVWQMEPAILLAILAVRFGIRAPAP